MNKKLKQAQGNVVTEERFWDRETDMKFFIEKLDAGAHILLTAQRRMGKTSLMAEAARLLTDRYTCLFIDLQKCDDSSDAIAELSFCTQQFNNLWEKTREVFSNVLNKIEQVQISELGVTLRSGLTIGNWSNKGDQLFDILAWWDKPVIIFIDEVPIMINRMLKDENFMITSEGRAEVDRFMSWLRKNSIKHQGKVRIVISGSIGLEPVLRQAGLSAVINNFVPFELKPWDEDIAIGCIEALANEYEIKFEDGAINKMIERLGCCIPHHVQMFFSHVREHYIRKKLAQCSVEDVGVVYKEEMLGVRGHAELTHYEERLKQVLGNELLSLALDMLSEAAITGCLNKEAIGAFQKEYTFDRIDTLEAEKEILWVVEHDGYLEQGSDGYVFVSKLLRDWWKKRYGNFFVPVLERGV